MTQPRLQILFIQGGGEGVHDEWDQKLAASLETALGPSCEVRYPRMPNEADPNFHAWGDAIGEEIARLDNGAVVVGHSVGGTILVHTLARRPELARRAAAIVLIAAPYVGDGGWPSDEIAPAADWAAPLAETAIRLYQGDADETVPMEHADLYAKVLPRALVRRLPGRDHQLNDDLSEVAEDIRRARTNRQSDR